ncbi:hypothetical protein WA026_002926 [Henosepilachna vigintioctopunctata]|uniref:Gustatory receptor n=1 Tax=Henosepilachna vigintioctopunctata TaxID=420089 RepID=A0AAW1TMM2_9CUCU
MKTYQKLLKDIWEFNERISISQMISIQLLYTLGAYFPYLLFLLLGEIYREITEENYPVYSGYLLELFQHTQMVSLLTTKVNLLLHFKFHYVSLIDKIKRYRKKETNWISLEILEEDILKDELRNLKEAVSLHEKICNLVDTFNSIFSLDILLIALYFTLRMLLDVSLLSIHLLQKTSVDNHKLDTEMIRKLTNIILSMVLPMILAYACASVVAEGERLIILSMSYFNQVNVGRRRSKLEHLAEYTSILCHQAKMRKPQFSACGFFLIDNSTLGMMFSRLTGNMMIILQCMRRSEQNNCRDEN